MVIYRCPECGNEHSFVVDVAYSVMRDVRIEDGYFADVRDEDTNFNNSTMTCEECGHEDLAENFFYDDKTDSYPYH